MADEPMTDDEVPDIKDIDTGFLAEQETRLDIKDIYTSVLAEQETRLDITPNLPCNALSGGDYDDLYTFYGSEDSSGDEEPPNTEPISIKIPDCLLVSPRSCYDPFEPPSPIMSERDALKGVTPRRILEDSSLELQLDDFAVYCNTDAYPDEMRPLHLHGTGTDLYFDGVVTNGTQSAYVRRVKIHALPIGNYGPESTDLTKDKIWIQSEDSAESDIYYRLKTPAIEYKRFFEPFLWVADLAKHCVDFLEAMYLKKNRVTIHHFRLDFAAWLHATYEASDSREEVLMWMLKYPRCDYGSAVNTNIAFLHKEAVGTLGDTITNFHTLWNEVHFFQKYTPAPTESRNICTVVTRYTYDCFNHLPFGRLLEVMDLGVTTKRLRSDLLAQRPSATFHMLPNRPDSADVSKICPGDTISTARDAVESGTVWEKEAARDDHHDELWFALVQDVSFDEDGYRVFEVIWYYRPVDTLCGLMKYPWSNELFLSDHCSCDEDSKIREDEVHGVHQVEFGGTPETTKDFFCRQMYLAEDRTWVSLSQAHLRCRHVQDGPVSSYEDEYSLGDTVLVRWGRNRKLCQPCEVVYAAEEFGRLRYTFRKLLSRRDVDSTASNAPPNEVVYTDETVKLGRSHIVGRCHVRWFAATEQIPTPYDRDGVGAYFFFTHQKECGEEGYTISPLDEAPWSMNQGPRQDSVPKLRGLDLFCGGGNFGRGLEEGGSIMMKWANDMDSKAIHTYMANAIDPEQVSPFLGSIDDFQRLAMQGQFADNVPRIGEVDFISGGSPCPGFSTMTNDRTTDPQRKNQSLVAAFASCVDLYRPKYGILENVMGIIQSCRDRDQDVFSQLMCALVGMGYQARLFFLDALSCGSAQMRSRVFIVFAAPGWTLPEKPLQTHSHPPSVKNASLGRLPTGEPMAKREIAKCTPFRYKSAAQATAGLPTIYDAKPDICVPFPDHRVVSGTNTNLMRNRVRLIPKFPYGMNFSQAWYGYYGTYPRAAGLGRLTKSERSTFPPSRHGENTKVTLTSIQSNAYGRRLPHQPMGTIVTAASPTDAKQGRTIHWNEDRCMTVLEAKRAQGFLDSEIILGTTTTQYKIVGNSVAREVSLALGTVITDAVMRSYGRDCKHSAVEQEDEEVEQDDEGEEEIFATSPLWARAARRRDEESETPGTSVPTSPGAAALTREKNGNNKRWRE
ncbi:DNA methyltransferase Dim-2 [Cordyceps militaris]|uniref:DNA (cytosine-5-)-methyltransferase n=1 Tax=Cordyceps militaris TaxID=73501 RepID=A0A2H4STL2_CORMI|nr:DNA methyltransferase Dim-2 [Cordyceps militaris]